MSLTPAIISSFMPPAMRVLLESQGAGVLNEIARLAEPPRRQAGMRLKDPGQMALVGKAAGESGVDDRIAPRQQSPRHVDAAIGEISVRRHARLATERAQKLETREVGNVGELLEIDGLSERCLEIVANARDARWLPLDINSAVERRIAAKQKPIGRDQTCVGAEPFFPRLHTFMGHAEQFERVAISHHRRTERRPPQDRPTRYLLGDLLHQPHRWISHAVAESAVQGAAVMNLAWVDQANIARAGIDSRPALTVDIAARADEADDVS